MLILDYLLQEDGDYLFQETGDKIILEWRLQPELPYQLEARDTSDNLLAILKNAFDINYTKQLNAPHILKFSLPADDSKSTNVTLVNEIWLRDNYRHEVVRKFRLLNQRDIRE